MAGVPINYLAVAAAALAQMILGFLWYGPLFGKKWLALSGRSQEEISAAGGMAKFYLLGLIASLVTSYVLAHVVVFGGAYTNTTGASAGLAAAFWSWLGFVAPVTLGSVLWENKPWTLWVLNNTYQLIALLIMGVILAPWI